MRWAVVVLAVCALVWGAYWLGEETARSPDELERQAQVRCSQDQEGMTYETCVEVVMNRLQNPSR